MGLGTGGHLERGSGRHLHSAGVQRSLDLDVSLTRDLVTASPGQRGAWWKVVAATTHTPALLQDYAQDARRLRRHRLHTVSPNHVPGGPPGGDVGDVAPHRRAAALTGHAQCLPSTQLHGRPPTFQFAYGTDDLRRSSRRGPRDQSRQPLHQHQRALPGLDAGTNLPLRALGGSCQCTPWQAIPLSPRSRAAGYVAVRRQRHPCTLTRSPSHSRHDDARLPPAKRRGELANRRGSGHRISNNSSTSIFVILPYTSSTAHTPGTGLKHRDHFPPARRFTRVSRHHHQFDARCRLPRSL